MSGTSYGGIISIWSLDLKYRIGMVECEGNIRNIFIQPNHDMIVLSNKGVFIFEDIDFEGYKKMPVQQGNKKITSSNICFLSKRGDG